MAGSWVLILSPQLPSAADHVPVCCICRSRLPQDAKQVLVRHWDSIQLPNLNFLGMWGLFMTGNILMLRSEV